MILKTQLQRLLKQKNLTASELSKLANVPKQSLSDWLAGSNPRDIRQVKRISDALGVSINFLCFGEGEKETRVEPVTDLDALLGDQWITGLFEVKLRRIKK